MIHKIAPIFLVATCIILIQSCGASHDVVVATSVQDEVEVEQKSLFKKLEENNHLPIKERIALYHQLKKENADEYDFDNDRDLNQYGYSLLWDDKAAEALEIFKLLVSEFPDNANAYDSLAEGYLKTGNDALALLNYEKTLEMDPNNNHAIDQVTILKGLELLVTDWGKEFFHFPIHFAPEIPFEGVEEVVFPRNWIKPDSSDFWSYVFVWELDNKTTTSAAELESTLKLYFDGLMDGKSGDSTMIKTEVRFEKNTDTADSVDFIGSLTIFDGFATKKPLDLNARIFSSYCKQKKKFILLFQFSPQEYSAPIWDKLRTVKIRSNVCEE